MALGVETLQGQAGTWGREAGQVGKRGRGGAPNSPRQQSLLGSNQAVPRETAEPVLPGRRMLQEKPSI